jgi:glutaredoxin
MTEKTIDKIAMTKFYGAMWCGDTRRARRWFDQHAVAYEWIDVDENADAAEYVKSLNNGMRSIPTLIFYDGSMLVEPTTITLENHAKTLRLI